MFRKLLCILGFHKFLWQPITCIYLPQYKAYKEVCKFCGVEAEPKPLEIKDDQISNDDLDHARS
jgi:hypothetical protein